MTIGPQIPRPEFETYFPEIISNQNYSPNKNHSMNPKIQTFSKINSLQVDPKNFGASNNFINSSVCSEPKI